MKSESKVPLDSNQDGKTFYEIPLTGSNVHVKIHTDVSGIQNTDTLTVIDFGERNLDPVLFLLIPNF